MPLSLSGTLTDPYGDPRGDATITFRAIVTSNNVLEHASASAITDSSGAYSVAVEFGRYNIEVKESGSPSPRIIAKNVLINGDTTAADLNQLVVDSVGFDDLTPQLVLDFYAVRDEVQGYRDDAQASAQAAATSETNADASEAAALASEQAAATSESNAASSASAASASETNAAASASAAQTSETNAADSEDLAEQWATSSTLVEGTYYGARKYALDAAASESAAAQSETNAAASEAAAASSASAAATSETNAGNSADAALASEQAAASSETNAAASEANAADSATAAAASETNADNNAMSASNSADAAATSETNAANSATNASGSASAAATSEANAAASEADADGSATEAEHWATYPIDTPVPEGDGSQYSSRHWAEISRQRAVNAMVAQGAWDASAGALPAEPAGASYWLVTGAPDGVTVEGVEYRNKDMLLWTPGATSSDPGQWSKIDNTDSVVSVAGKSGAVELVPSDVGADPAGTAAAKVAEHEAKDNAHTPAQVGADPAGTADTKVAEHEAKSSAHTPAQVGADPAGTAAQSVSDHVAAPDPHSQYAKSADLGTAAAASAEFLSNSPYCTDTGAADAYVLSTNYAPAAPSAYRAGDQYRFRAGAANTGPATVNINGLGAKTLVTVTGVALPAGYIRTDVDTTITYDAPNDRFVADREVETLVTSGGSLVTRFSNGSASASSSVSVSSPSTVVTGAGYQTTYAYSWDYSGVFSSAPRVTLDVGYISGGVRTWPAINPPGLTGVAFVLYGFSDFSSGEFITDLKAEGLWYES